MKVCSSCQRCYDDSTVHCAEESHPILSETLAGGCEMIAGYRLELLSESGGRYSTYRARHTISGQPCFIRIITANVNDSSEFLREAQIASALFHPNVAGVYEAGTLDGVGLYIVTEDAGGQTLREYLTGSGVPPLLTSIQIVEQAAAGLDAIHHSGLIHRSVRPENIVLTTDHDQQLLVRVQNPDLGGVVGRSILSDKFLIETALGSLRYFSPEQFSGEALSAQSDVYSLGVMFYEMLAGVPPFDSATAAGVIHKHRNEPPPDIRIDNFELRMLVTHSLMESLQKQPRSRTASAMAFARQMRHIEQLATHTSTPPPAVSVPELAPIQRTAAVIVSTPPKPVQPVPVQPAPAAFISAIDEELDLRAITTAEIIPADSVEALSEPVAIPIAEAQPAVADVLEFHAAQSEPEAEPAYTLSEIEIEPVEECAVEDESPVVFDDEGAESITDTAFESERAATLKTAAEPVHEISLVITIPDLPEPTTPAEVLPEAAAIESGAEEENSAIETVATPHRSRLKHLRRKLHTMTPHAAAEVPEIAPVPEPAAPELTIAQIETDLIPVIQAEPETIDIAPIQPTPKVIEWDLPEDDIPSLEEVMEVRVQEHLVANPVPMPPLQPIAPQQVVIEEPAIDEPIFDEPVIEQEEVWQAETVSTVAASEFEFLASVVRQPDHRKSGEFDPRGSLFATYGAEAAARSGVGHRSLIIGGGFVAAMVLLLAGDVIVNEDARPQGTVEEAAVTIPAQKSQLPLAVVRTEVASATEQKPLKNFKPPADAVQADRTNTAQPNVDTPTPMKPPTAPSAARDEASSEPPIIVGARRNGGRPPVRSTLVISSDNGRIKKKVENDNTPAETRSSSAPDKAASGTRPRIVVSPR